MTVASADYVESFCSAAEMVLTQLLGDSPVRGDLVDLSAPVFPLQQMNIGVGITGDVRGQVNFGFERSTGLSIAGAMMYEEIADFSEMSLSALSELSNMISGNATIGISAAGIKCDITPPTILMGASVRASWFGMRSVTVPLQLPCGAVHVTVGIRLD